MFDISPFVAISSESLHRNTCFTLIVLQIYFIFLNLAFIWWYYYCDNAVFVFLSMALRGAVTGLCISVRIWGVHHWPWGQRLGSGESNDVTRPTSPPRGKAFHHSAHVCYNGIDISAIITHHYTAWIWERCENVAVVYKARSLVTW